MAGKAIWKGYINFKDINLPVKLHTAIKEERTRFHLLHKQDHAKLRQQLVCAYEKEPVPVEAQVKGYEVEKGKYIIVDPAELEKADPESSRMIDIHEFVKTGQIDPIFLECAYYLEPDMNTKAYNTLAGTLKEMDVAGICTWTMRKRAYIGALQTSGKLLRLNTLRYSDEIISAKSLELPRMPLSEKELKIGMELINQLSAPFQPQKFENEHEKKLKNLIDKKVRGEKIVVLRPRQLKPTESDKLLQSLQASLKKVA